ncbi:MAG: hypothetical protein WA741_21785 [Candidatus Sulfotelmatobacter sp.]
MNTTTDCQTAPFPFWATQATHVTETLALSSAAAYSQLMRIVRAIMLQTRLFPLLIVMALSITVSGATRVHVIALGKWTSVQWFPGGADDKPLTLKIRALVVDGRVKEFVLGAPHEVTDRLFVVRRMFRVNDSLPEDSAPRWQWQRGGWLLVDRLTGRVAPINLPEFDAYYSAASWYRDYVAYCGVADDGKKTYAMVAQLSRRKPVLKRELANAGLADDSAPDSACPVPNWQRGPVRVSFEPGGSAKQTFAIRGHVVDLVNDAEEEEEGAK